MESVGSDDRAAAPALYRWFIETACTGGVGRAHLEGTGRRDVLSMRLSRQGFATPKGVSACRPGRDSGDIGWEHHRNHPACVGSLEPDQPTLSEPDHRTVGIAGQKQSSESSEVG